MDDNKKGKLPSSLYLTSDSRVTEKTPNGHKKYKDNSQKLFYSTTQPDIFAICGDYKFSKNAVCRFICKIDIEGLFDANTPANQKHQMFIEHLNSIDRKGMYCESVILYATKYRGNFHLHKISINKENIDSSELDLGSVSTICVSDGSGDKEFSEKWLGYNHDSKSFNEYATSRGAFRFVYDTIPIISDEYVGGHMQALVLYRGKEKPVAIGVLYEDGAYVLGKKNHSDIGIDIEYRNENFEIIDPSTMKIKEGAQRQPFATR